MALCWKKLKFRKSIVKVVVILSSSLAVLRHLFQNTHESTNGETISFDPPLSQLEQRSEIDFNIERQFFFGGRRTNVSHGLNRIPKLLHFIWTDENIPEMFVNNLKSFRLNNPAWRIYLWTFERGRYLISQREPQLLPTFDGYMMNVVKADVIKYVVMFHYGGAYFDLDTRSIKPLEQVTQYAECVLSPEAKENAIVYLQRHSVMASSVFMCRAGHPLFRYFIDQLPYYSQEKSIMAAAGPLFVTWNIEKFIDRQRNAALLREYPHNETFSFSVVSSEIFEDHILDETLRKFARECDKHKLDRERTGENSINPSNPKSEAWLQTVKSCCIYWQARGGIHRQLTTKAITVHEHVGTYLPNNRKKIERSKKYEIQDFIQESKILSYHDLETSEH